MTKSIFAVLCVFISTSLAVSTPVPQHVTLTTDAGEITFLAASVDGRYLAAASLDSYVFVWETSGWKRIASVSPEPPPKAAPGEHQDEFSSIQGLAFSPDSQTVAYASAGVLYTYSLGSKMKRSRGKTDAEALAFTPDGVTLIASTPDGSVEMWDTQNWQKHTAPIPIHIGMGSGAISVSFAMLPLPTTAGKPVEGGFQVAISPGNRFVASGVTSDHNRQVVVWDVGKKAVAFAANLPQSVWAVAFLPDSSRFFAGEVGPPVKIIGWNTHGWNQMCVLGGAGAYQFAATSQWLAAGGGEHQCFAATAD